MVVGARAVTNPGVPRGRLHGPRARHVRVSSDGAGQDHRGRLRRRHDPDGGPGRLRESELVDVGPRGRGRVNARGRPAQLSRPALHRLTRQGPPVAHPCDWPRDSLGLNGTRARADEVRREGRRGTPLHEGHGQRRGRARASAQRCVWSRPDGEGRGCLEGGRGQVGFESVRDEGLHRVPSADPPAFPRVSPGDGARPSSFPAIAARPADFSRACEVRGPVFVGVAIRLRYPRLNGDFYAAADPASPCRSAAFSPARERSPTSWWTCGPASSASPVHEAGVPSVARGSLHSRAGHASRDGWVDGAALTIVNEYRVSRARPSLEIGLFPSTVRHGDGAVEQLENSVEVTMTWTRDDRRHHRSRRGPGRRRGLERRREGRRTPAKPGRRPGRCTPMEGRSTPTGGRPPADRRGPARLPRIVDRRRRSSSIGLASGPTGEPSPPTGAASRATTPGPAAAGRSSCRSRCRRASPAEPSYASNVPARARRSPAPSPAHALPCMHARVVGSRCGEERRSVSLVPLPWDQ